MTDFSFSIVIPTYNREKFLINTLNSVFTQTYDNYEVIVVDDCSTDDTEKILFPLIESGKINFIKHQKNYERSKSRNTGMENATGDFVTFLDSDDFMYPNCLADANVFAKNNPGLKCFHNLIEVVNEDRQFLYSVNYAPLTDSIKDIAKGNFMSCIGNFISREIYRQYRFDTNLKSGEDWDFWLRVLVDYPLGRINKVNSAACQHNNRSVASIDLSQAEHRLNYIVKKINADPHLLRTYKKYLGILQSSIYTYLASLAISEEKFNETKSYLKKSAESDAKVVFDKNFIKLLLRSFLKISNRNPQNTSQNN